MDTKIKDAKFTHTFETNFITFYDEIKKSHALYQLDLQDENHSKFERWNFFSSTRCCPKSTKHSAIFDNARRRTSGFVYKVKEDCFAQKFNVLIHTTYETNICKFVLYIISNQFCKCRWFTILSSFIAISCLFLKDITYCWLPKDADYWTLDIFMTAVFCFVSIEKIL